MDPNQAAIDADLIEIAAYREIVAAAPAPLAQALGLKWVEVADAGIVLAPAISDPTFNRVMGLGLQQVSIDAELDAVCSACRSVTDQPYWIHLHPLARPAALESWLVDRGFKLAKRRSWAKVARGRDAPPEFKTPLTIRVARPSEFTPAAEVARAA